MSRITADAWVSQREDTIANRIDARRDAVNAKRWPQVLLTHTFDNIPADGIGVRPDRLDVVATDNMDGWDKLNLNIGGNWDAALEVNNYGDSRGAGCEYVAYVKEGGALYRKVYKVEGHQRYRLSDWIKVPDDDGNRTRVIR